MRHALHAVFPEHRHYNTADVAYLPTAKGAYILALRIPDTVGNYGGRHFSLDAGWYLYAGSAHGPGGIKARLNRHFTRGKKPHWHIDQLNLAATDRFALCFESGDECVLTAILLEHAGASAPLRRFGSTDCDTCAAHLLKLPQL